MGKSQEMDVIEEIFAEYRRMRQHGLDANQALRALRTYVEPLDTLRREELARRLRVWEQSDHRETNTAAPEPKPVEPLKQSSFPKLKPQESAEVWVECEHCKRKNRQGEIFCFACGQLLNIQQGGSTRHFASAGEELFNQEYYGIDSVVIFSVQGNKPGRFEIRPQLRQNEMVLGRSAKNVAVRPEIDLAEVGGAEKGVSRLHAALSYDSTGEMIHIYDLGSANGTFLNGQRLHPT
ncbi:MAG: FHA domain-containing protein, partial [Anaerolineae bacterium]|nr:FHA domain-containing protein [Anaerolineae bacterium]